MTSSFASWTAMGNFTSWHVALHPFLMYSFIRYGGH